MFSNHFQFRISLAGWNLITSGRAHVFCKCPCIIWLQKVLFNSRNEQSCSERLIHFPLNIIAVCNQESSKVPHFQCSSCHAKRIKHIFMGSNRSPGSFFVSLLGGEGVGNSGNQESGKDCHCFWPSLHFENTLHRREEMPLYENPAHVSQRGWFPIIEHRVTVMILLMLFYLSKLHSRRE